MKEKKYRIRTIERALRVLDVLSDGRQRTLTELSRDIGEHVSTTYRILITLIGHNYIERDTSSNTYKLSIGCLELAHAYMESLNIRREAHNILENLRDDTKETVHLAILEGMEVVYVEKFYGLHAIGMMSSVVGGRAPAYCTGLGKILLAYDNPNSVKEYFSKNKLHRFTKKTICEIDKLMQHLSQIRKQGYAYDFGEHEAEVRCIAAPVFDISGKVVAAVSVSGPASRMDPIENQYEIREKVLNAAKQISKRLGYKL